MLKLKVALSFLLMVFSFQLFAISQINVSIINKKGMDNNFDLVDELHISEIFYRDQSFSFKMNNGLEVRLKLKMVPATEVEGKHYNLEGEVYRANGSRIGDISPNPVKLNYVDPLYFEVKDLNRQLVMLTIRLNDVKAKR